VFAGGCAAIEAVVFRLAADAQSDKTHWTRAETGRLVRPAYRHAGRGQSARTVSPPPVAERCALIVFVIGAAASFGWLLASLRVPTGAVALLTGSTHIKAGSCC
jgi:hypothetical protein